VREEEEEEEVVLMSVRVFETRAECMGSRLARRNEEEEAVKGFM